MHYLLDCGDVCVCTVSFEFLFVAVFWHCHTVAHHHFALLPSNRCILMSKQREKVINTHVLVLRESYASNS